MCAVLLLNVLAQDLPPRPGTLRIYPSVPAPDGQHPDVAGILRRSADIISLVRCGTPMPDGKGQAMFDAICARVLAKQ